MIIFTGHFISLNARSGLTICQNIAREQVLKHFSLNILTCCGLEIADINIFSHDHMTLAIPQTQIYTELHIITELDNTRCQGIC